MSVDVIVTGTVLRIIHGESLCLCLSVFVSVSVCLSACLSVCLSIMKNQICIRLTLLFLYVLDSNSVLFVLFLRCLLV